MPSGPNAVEILSEHVKDLGSLTPGLRQSVEDQALVVSKPRSTVLFEEGTHCGGMVLLHRGVIRVSRQRPNGREFTLYRVTPAEMCVITLSCVLAESEYPARGVVEQDIHGVLLPIPLFERLTDEVAAFRRYIFESFAARLIEVVDLASAATFEHLPSRLASLLTRRSRIGESDRLEITHQELATELGTVRERVSRMLESFEKLGVVTLGRGVVRILDRAALDELTGPPDPASPRGYPPRA